MKNKIRHKIIPGLLVLLLFLVVYSYIYDSKLDLNGDNATYYMLGKALSEGHGYVNLNSVEQTANNHFPPGYPVIINGIIKIFGNSFTVPKLFNGFCLLGALILLFYSGRALTNSLPIVMLTIFSLLLNSHLLRFSTIMMSEMPFLLLTLLAIFSFSKSKPKKLFYKDYWFFLCLLFIVWSFYTRTTGIALLIGVVLYLLHQRNWRQALAYTFGFGLLVAPWLVRGQLLGGNSYLHQLVMVNPYRPSLGVIGPAEFVTRVWENFIRYVSKEIPSAAFSFNQIDYQQSSPIWLWVIGIAFMAFAGFGLSKLQRYRALIISYIIATFGILFIWPQVWVGVRFLLPLLPFLLLGFFIGLEALIKQTGSTKPWVFWLPAIFLFIHIRPLAALNQQSTRPYNNSWVNYLAMAEYLKQNEINDVVVACRKPVIFYLYSNTYTTNYKYTTDQEEFLDDLKDKQVDYVVLEQLGYSSTLRYLFPVFRDQPDLFDIIVQKEKPNTYLVKLLQE